jgi:uncharacterized membrane protein
MKKFFFIVLITITCLSLSALSQTKLKLVNNTSQTISAAYAKYQGEETGWTSYGWWNINAGGSKIIDLGNYNYTNLYVYGFYKNTGWGSGSYQFCVDFKNAFNIENADKECNYSKRQFDEFKIVAGKVNTWNFNPKSNVNSNNNSNKNVTTKKIEIYTLSGCSICAHSIEYMKQHSIRYTEYSTEIEENMNNMFGLLCKSGCTANIQIKGPVFVINGKVYYNIENIDDFLSKL